MNVKPIVRIHSTMRAPDGGPFHRTSRRFGTCGPLPSEYWKRTEMLHIARIHETLHNSAPDSALTGQSAALAHGLDVLLPSIHIELAIRARHSRPRTRIGIRGHGFAPSTVTRRRRNLPKSAYCQTHCGRSLTIEATIIEFGREPNLYSAMVTIESAVRHLIKADRNNRPKTYRRFKQLLKRLNRLADTYYDPRYRHRIKSRLALVSPWSESPGETISRLRLQEAGLPDCKQQHRIVTDNSVFYADFCLPDKGLVIEFDGQVKYKQAPADSPVATPLQRPPDPFKAQEQREDKIRKQFPLIIRLTWADLWDDHIRNLLHMLFPTQLREPPRRRGNFNWYTAKRDRIHELPGDFDYQKAG